MTRTILSSIISGYSKGLEAVSGATLLSVVVLTIADIVGRSFGKPIVGAYELVSAAGGLVISFAMPISTMEKKHVVIDLVLEYLPVRSKMVFHVISRALVAILFLVLGWAFIEMGRDIRTAKEVSSVLQFPLYPLVYAMGGVFLGECLVLVDDLLGFAAIREVGHE